MMTQVAATGRVDVTVRQLLEFVFRFRRLEAGNDLCAAQPCRDCFATHWDKIREFVRRDEPVHFVIPAFPAKSRNPAKVLGTLPDLGERLAIDFLQSFCDQLSHFHPPGARITICSDGHVFNDVLGISDGDVTDYRTELRRIIGATGGGSVDLYSLEDAFGPASYDDMRELLDAKYADSIDAIRQRVRTDRAERALFNGIHRFMIEDYTPLYPQLSNTKRRAMCKELAFQVIARSRAWGALVGEVFPDSVRLSIHPQPSHGDKIGFHLIRTRDSWLTPWHGVVIDDGTTFTLTKRSHAEAMNASLIWRDSLPSHFVHPHALSGEIEP